MATQNPVPPSKRFLVIDTDAGIDDAAAILLALSYADEWEILAITCCHGNTDLDNVCQNVMKIMVASDNTKIPLYRGCEQSLVRKCAPGTFHGKDGLGNVADEFSTGGLEVSNLHAVNILMKLAKEYPNEITLLALGPLTNLAMAHRMDPNFTKNLKSIVLMGGNIHGVGNITHSAEFNFYSDPESAHIITTEALCPILMVPWETTLNHSMEWATYFKWIEVDTKKGRFIKKITAYTANILLERERQKFVDCDLHAAAAILCPQSVEDFVQYPVSVETTGLYTRGQSVIERSMHLHDKSREKKYIKIVTKLNDELLNELRFKLVN